MKANSWPLIRLVLNTHTPSSLSLGTIQRDPLNGLFNKSDLKYPKEPMYLHWGY